ncbi:hypothetical protein [Halococcoides cellulosivorans]|uniref:hypothetical protein n=1 Tax=Halococcoides cellulosivorans TaxID=1679096 RepID=UPI00131F46A8|nr:hypothetical protein [Halococcoides cellulosivorans]
MNVDDIKEDGRFFIEKHDEIVEYAREELETEEDKRGRVVKNTIVNEYKVGYIYDYLNSVSECSTEIEGGLERIQMKNEILRDEFTESFDKRCAYELNQIVNQYPMIVCHILGLDPMNDEVRQSLSQRDSIHILLDYLGEDDLPEGLRPQVEALDEVMSCIMKFYRSDEISDLKGQIAIEYFPDSFWWRHPDQLLSDQ